MRKRFYECEFNIFIERNRVNLGNVYTDRLQDYAKTNGYDCQVILEKIGHDIDSLDELIYEEYGFANAPQHLKTRYKTLCMINRILEV